MWLRRIRANMIEPSTYDLRKPAPASWQPTAGYILNPLCCQAFYHFYITVPQRNEKCLCTHMIWERLLLRLNKNTFSPKTHPRESSRQVWGVWALGRPRPVGQRWALCLWVVPALPSNRGAGKRPVQRLDECVDECRRDQEVVILVSLKTYASQKQQWWIWVKNWELDDTGEFLFLLIGVKMLTGVMQKERPYFLVILRWSVKIL